MEGERSESGGRAWGLATGQPALFQRLVALPRPALAALAFASVLIVYGNLVSALPEAASERYEWALILGNLSLMLVALLWAAKWPRLSLAEVGFAPRRLLASATWGLGLAALVIIPVVIYFTFPVGVPGGDIDYEGTSEESLGTFLLWALVTQPISTSLVEETAFRGILQALALRAYGLLRGILLVGLVFALWHLVVNFRTVQETSLADDVALTVLA